MGGILPAYRAAGDVPIDYQIAVGSPGDQRIDCRTPVWCAPAVWQTPQQWSDIQKTCARYLLRVSRTLFMGWLRSICTTSPPRASSSTSGRYFAGNGILAAILSGLRLCTVFIGLRRSHRHTQRRAMRNTPEHLWR